MASSDKAESRASSISKSIQDGMGALRPARRSWKILTYIIVHVNCHGVFLVQASMLSSPPYTLGFQTSIRLFFFQTRVCMVQVRLASCIPDYV